MIITLRYSLLIVRCIEVSLETSPNLAFSSTNPNPALRKRKILGMEILEGLRYNAHNHSWENGKIYDATSGRYWDSSASLTKDGILKVRGFWKFKWIGKSMTFKKISNDVLTKL